MNKLRLIKVLVWIVCFLNIQKGLTQDTIIDSTAVIIKKASWLDDLETLLGAGTKNKINGWINNGLDEAKTKSAFSDTINKVLLFHRLETAKSIYHQRVYIQDWDNIPGISKTTYTVNGLQSGKTHSAWNNPDLDLPASEAQNFVTAVAIELPAGTKIYRVTGGNKAGAYWTIQMPDSIFKVIGGTAVRPEWNDFSRIYVYEVPNGETLKVWEGVAARQQMTQGILNPHLPGGYQQLFIPLILRNNTFSNLVTEIKLPW